ncbi:hypothetical protein [Caldisalinibacter kiritimatiensis]|uniref:Uncharacterized protein n=1 Tax=Caldisalinibacter kiritimatiensis TaxID=1304284 RepID=R1AYY2_9FIRM|nr:hypothetical protein [Caldisalinibacter kiritimatiensis]EOD01912.1 hypothetical protein L21TH_0018 [Caldisalinibacter kiritimatiensis]
MVVNTNIAFAIKCDICGQLKEYNMSLFDFKKNKVIDLECTCGEANAIVQTKDYKNFWLQIPCFECQDIHVFKYTLKQLVKGNIITRCVETGKEIAFIGSPQDVKELVNEYKGETNDLLTELGFYDYFVNSEVMIQCINKIRDLEREDKIKCECGNNSIEVNIYEDRIELKCRECESIQVIYAENEGDLENLLNKKSILMHKNTFQCLDAINHNNE